MQKQTIIMKNRTVEQVNQLENLELKEEWFDEVSEKIFMGQSQKTNYDAKCAAGVRAYLESVRALREALCPHAWIPYREKNLEFVKHSKNGIMIMPSSGDSNTGNEFKNPKTKNPKGQQTIGYINNTNMQYRRLPIQNQLWTEQVEKNEKIWFFLFHIDESKREIRSELSLPYKINDNKIKSGNYKWQKRILFPPIKFDVNPELNKKSTDYENKFIEEIDINIKRKSGE